MGGNDGGGGDGTSRKGGDNAGAKVAGAFGIGGKDGKLHWLQEQILSKSCPCLFLFSCSKKYLLMNRSPLSLGRMLTFLNTCGRLLLMAMLFKYWSW